MSAYHEYLDTPEWWATRKRALARADYRCERCGSTGSLQTHHLTYVRLGAEREDDVQILCDPCHHAEHLPRNKRKRELERYGQQRLFERWPFARRDVAA